MFSKMKLVTKVTLSLLFLDILTIAIGLGGYVQLSTLEKSYSKMYDEYGAPLATWGRLGITFQSMRTELRGALLDMGDADKQDQHQASLDAMLSSRKDMETEVGKTILDKADKDTFSIIKNDMSTYDGISTQLMELCMSNAAMEEINPLVAQTNMLGSRVQSRIVSVINEHAKVGKDIAASKSKEVDNAKQFLIYMEIISAVIAIVLTYLLFLNIRKILEGMWAESERLVSAATDGDLSARGEITKVAFEFRPIILGFNHTLDAMLKPIQEVADVLKSLSNKDLTARVEGDYRGDFNDLKNYLNEACFSLEEVVTHVSSMADHVAQSAAMMAEAAENVGGASHEVASGASQVAAGAGDQSREATDAASHMEQLQRAIEEVARGTQVQAAGAEEAAMAAKQSADAIKRIIHEAENARQVAEEAGSAAKTGAATTTTMLQSMEKARKATALTGERVNALGTASKRIGDIVEVINDIAEQTNLLGLNSAIEAARAGEHGRGFAVVADEVRKLAERSATQTKEIAALIRDIQEGIAEAVNSMAVGSKEIDGAAEMTEEAGRVLSTILSAVEKVALRTADVASVCVEVDTYSSRVLQSSENVSAATEEATASAEEMAATSVEVTQSIERVAQVTEQAAATSQQLSAAAEEQNALVEEVTSASHEIAKLARDVQEAVSVFTVGSRE